jgi:hypothetical protein
MIRTGKLQSLESEIILRSQTISELKLEGTSIIYLSVESVMRPRFEPNTSPIYGRHLTVVLSYMVAEYY